MTDQTPASEESTEEAPLSEETESTSDEESTETVESLKEQLAAQTEKTEEANEKADRWKGRVKEENPPKKKKEETSEDYADWRIDNRDRIAHVKEEFDKELDELQSSGAILTNDVRDKALKLAESTVGVKKVETTEPIPEGGTDRGGQREPEMTKTDIAFKVKPSTKKKYSKLEKEW